MDPLKIKTIEVRPGQVFTATAQVFDQDGNVMTNQDVTWKSSNPVVAAPDRGTGLTVKIWGKNPGQATLVASCGTAFQTFIVNVVAYKAHQVEITLSTPK